MCKSFIYFANWIKIWHPTKGSIPLAMYDYQKELIKACENNNFTIAKKFRQGGFTTVIASWLLWQAMFYKDKRVLINTKTDREAVYISRIVRKMISELPDFLKPELTKENDHTLQFSHDSSMRFHTSQQCCGIAVNILYIDEPAFIQDMDSHWKAMWPTLSAGGKTIAVSTPNGTRGWFYETYQKAKNSENQWHVFKAEYTQHPDYSNEEWVKRTKNNLGEKFWRQEVLQEFFEPTQIHYCKCNGGV